MIRLFCRETREFFQVSGVYFWQCLSPDEMVGAEADGVMAERFRGLHMKASESAVAGEAVAGGRIRSPGGKALRHPFAVGRGRYRYRI